MSKIELSGRAPKDIKILAEKVALDVLKFMNQPLSLEVAISFVSQKEIQRLNREIRGIDKVTDVLSFPSTETKPGEIFDENSEEVLFLRNEEGFIHFGDMAICLDQTQRQANEYCVTLEDEVKKLVIHSMLHLMGYDHIEDSDFEIMNKKEVELFEKIKI